MFLNSSLIMMFRSRVADAILCLPLGVVISFSSSKVSNTGEMVPSALLTRIIALSFLLLPKDLTASLQSRFKCSLWRSAGIFRPLHP